MSLGNQFGLLPQGFVRKSVDDIDADLDAALKAAFGASINTSAQARFGQLKGIMAERYDELWALAESVHAAFNPDAATASDLVNVAAITGTLPLVPTPSTVAETATGTPGTVLPIGRQVNVTGTNSAFLTTAAGTIVLLPNWANGINYARGNRVNAGGKAWQCLTPGLSAVSPTGAQGSVFVDGALTWLCLGTGTGAVDVPMSSQQTGPVIAAVGTLTQIQTPVAGWASAYNVQAALLGQNTESDPAFRVRREQELRGIGKAAVEAIRAAVRKVPGVTACTVFENVTDFTNSDGMPPHSVEIMCQGGDPAAIAKAAFANVAAGIATTGNQAPVTVTDSQGINHSVKFSRPTLVSIWITVNALVDPNFFPANGVAEIINNLTEYGSLLVADYDVFSSQLAAAILNGVPSLAVPGVSGVLDPGLPLIGTANPPVSSATVSISSRQLAVFDPSRIVVNTTNGSP